MRKALSLARVYIESVYGFSGLKDNLKKGWKGILKLVGIGFLLLYCLGAFGAIFVMMNLNIYDALRSVGMERLLFLNSVVIATAITLIMGFITCLSTYFLSESELSLLSLPMRSWELFLPKFAMSYLSELLISGFIILISVVVYAMRSSPPPLFYPYALISILLVPLVPLTLIYAVLIPVMRAGGRMRNKNALLMAGGIFGLAFALGFQILYQRLLLNMENDAWLLTNVAGPDSFFVRIGMIYPPSYFVSQALARADRLEGLANILLLIAFSGIIVLAALLLLSRPYAKSLHGFNETFLKKLKSSERFIAKAFGRRGRFTSLFIREFTMMNREPVFFLNGPFIVVLMPVILAVMAIAQKDAILAPLESALAQGDASLILPLAGAAFGAFLGSATSIASTALSREGSHFPFVRSLPIKASEYFGAKFAHHLAFCLLGALIGPISVAFISPLSFFSIVLSGFAAISFSSLIGVFGLFLDTAFPKLSWTNPTAALKQNMNSAIVVIASMAVLGGLGTLLGIIGLKPWMLPAITLICAALASAGWIFYLPFAARRFSEIE